MKVAIYARYSSDNQRDASIADQFRVCREFAQRQGWQIAREYSDHAVSGATLLRPGFQGLMREALRNEFDIVLAEALDRFSRDQEDTAGLFKRLTFAGVSIVTLAEGDITHLHIGLKGTMNALFLKELAEKTRRGIELGKAGGGLCYGYRVVRQFLNGVMATGDREINAEEAAVVRRIFENYTAGVSSKQIAKTLNREGVRGPKGSLWNPSTIHGNPKRGIGMLNNELYIGRHGLEPTAFCERPGYRETFGAVEPVIRVDHERRAWTPDRERRGLAVGKGQAGIHSPEVVGEGAASIQPVPATEVPVLGPDEMRRVWSRLHRVLAGAPRMLWCTWSGHLQQQTDDSPTGSRRTSASRASRQIDAQGFFRGILSRVREGDEPASHGAARRPHFCQARAGAVGSPTQEAR